MQKNHCGSEPVTFVATIDEWLCALAHPNITSDAAQRLYGCFFDLRSVGQINPSVLLHIYRRFEEDSWKVFVTRLVQDALANYKLVADSNIYDTVNTCAAFWPIIRECAPYITETYYPEYSGKVYHERLQHLLRLVSDNTRPQGMDLMCVLASGKETSETKLDMLLRMNWSLCWVLPIPALHVLFTSAQTDPRFMLGSENDLKLCEALAADMGEYSKTHYWAPGEVEHLSAGPVYHALLHMANYAPENRYWRFMTYGMAASKPKALDNTQLAAWHKQVLKTYALSSNSTELLHTMQVVEVTPGRHLPSWFSQLVDSGLRPKDRVDAWARLVPEFAQNHQLWRSLGLTKAEQMRACIDLRESLTRDNTSGLPNDLSL